MTLKYELDGFNESFNILLSEIEKEMNDYKYLMNKYDSEGDHLTYEYCQGQYVAYYKMYYEYLGGVNND